MIVAKIKVDGACAVAEYRKLIPAGIIGAQVLLDYADGVWQGLHKTVVFRGAVTKDVITDAEVVTIPAEVVAKRGVALQVGVYGVDADGNLAIPTIWADLGTVRDAADPSGDATTDPSLPIWAQIQAMIGNLEDLDTTAKNNLVAAVNEAMTKGGGEVDAAEIQRIVEDYLAANPPTVTESDPTVPAWAKQPTKPTYTASEVGALPDTYTPPNQTAQQVGADPAGTAASAVSQHNTDAAAHNDLRLALQELANHINAALDSDDTTLDQMSEVVAYIKSNKSLIDAITTSKVSVSDIVNDLVTNVADKPLSAAQGVALKQLIDALRNDKLDAAELTNAVNTALAQAKASGEFDGQDGATPNIQIGTVETLPAGSPATASMTGTAENPLLNLGIPQGATGSGEGGSGIAVTGATVGQTVRIAAVDDDGVPTAWEPVDLPSGGCGDVVDLIADFTTEEATSAIVVSEDMDGKPFTLKKVIFTLFTKGNSESTLYVYFGVNGKNIGGSNNMGNNTVTTNRRLFGWIERYNDGRVGFMVTSNPSTLGDTASVIESPVYFPWIASDYNYNGITFEPITSFQFYTYGSIVAGARVVIYGVRA